jgi:hypothetical protein
MPKLHVVLADDTYGMVKALAAGESRSVSAMTGRLVIEALAARVDADCKPVTVITRGLPLKEAVERFKAELREDPDAAKQFLTSLGFDLGDPAPAPVEPLTRCGHPDCGSQRCRFVTDEELGPTVDATLKYEPVE